MANKMLIDASHPEETRVVVLRGNRVQEFDFEAADKKPLRGNIYLAKVTRVEPSLQAAFVDYGGNRHGFLAFAEIHPDYYQIPVADRQALLEEESRAHQQDEEEEHRPHGRGRRSRRRQHEGAEKRAERRRGRDQRADRVEPRPRSSRIRPNGLADTDEGAVEAQPGAGRRSRAERVRSRRRTPLPSPSAPSRQWSKPRSRCEASVAETHQPISVDPSGFGLGRDRRRPRKFRAETPEPDHELKARRQDERDEERERAAGRVRRGGRRGQGARTSAPPTKNKTTTSTTTRKSTSSTSAATPWTRRPIARSRPRRQYKIQEVIKRRQVLLVQVVKEERGNKGAALTTYLSLAGRYSVLMPNTARGGGISRKITDGADRKRLKEIVQDLEVPEGHGRHPAHRRRDAHQGRRSSATSNICCACGRACAN